MRTFSGQDQSKALTHEVLTAYQKLFPVERDGHKMELAKIWVDEQDLDTHDYTDQKKTKLAGHTWGLPVYASMVLKDQDGKVVDKIEKVRLSTIPKLTPRNSFIVKGNEYQVANQMIRKPGAYVVKTQKGDTYKGQIALGGERTHNFEIHLNPESNKYSVEVGGTKKPLYPLLKALGATDNELIAAWGEPIFLANKKESPADYIGLAKKFAYITTDNQTTAQEALRAFAKTTKSDPHVTKLTLGTEHSELNHKMLVDTSKKLLGVYQGTATTDDPENLLFKEIRSVEDMIHDKLGSAKEQAALKKMLGRHLGRKSSIKKMVDFKKLTSPVESFFINDNRTSTPEQYNPVHMLSEMNKLTIHGTGGITSAHAVSDSLREVHPSHLGFVDPISTPESEKIGTTLHLTAGTVKDGREIRTMLVNLRTGKKEFLTPRELNHRVVAFPDEMENGKIKNPKSVRVQHEGQIKTVPSSQVDYIIPDASRLFSYGTNLVPFLKNDQGNRAVMASKMLGQALSLVHREAPLVQSVVEGKHTFQDLIGKEFSVYAAHDGIVQEVTADHLKIGGKTIPLYNNFPLNQKTQLHHTPLVKVGDKVKAGQLIADSNYTRGGSLALGVNLKSVSGDTNVFWIDKNGPHFGPISKVTPEKGVLTPTIVGNKAELKELKAYIGHYTDEGMVRVKTWSGYHFKCTESHSLVVLRDGALTEIKPKDLILDSDFVPRARKITTPVMLDEVAIGDKMVKLTREFGELCGLYLAEGWTTHSAVGIAATDLDVIARIQYIVSVALPGVVTTTGIRRVNIYSSALKKFFLQHFSRLADHKRVGDFCFGAPLEFRRGLLAGYWSGDGCVRSTENDSLDVTAWSNSEKLRDGLSFLGLTLGLRFNFLTYHRTWKGVKKEIYGLRLLNVDAPKFPEMHHSYKQKNLELGLKTNLGWQISEMIPLSKSDQKLLRERVYSVSCSRRNTLFVEIKRGYVGSHIIKEFYPEHPWYNDSLCWERVRSIKPVKYEEWVYDLDMGASPYFMVSNGIFVHNTAYLPYPSLTFEDGIVITESAAKKLSAEQTYKSSFPLEKGKTDLNFKRFLSQHPNLMKKEDHSKYTDDGVIRKGQVVQPGQMLVAGLRYNLNSPENLSFRKLNKSLLQPWTGAPSNYLGEFPGVVTDVVRKGDAIEVYVKAVEPARESDKLSGVHGNKGVITKVIPDKEAPHAADGSVPDVFLNPHGVVGRINLGQLYESAAGKIAQKTGKTYLIKNFEHGDTNKKISDELKHHGITDTEALFTPDGKPLGNVHVGMPHILRLAKTGKSGFSARMPGEGYDANLQPLKGGEEGTKSLDQLTFYSMLSHGAKKNLLDAHIKSEKNDEYWRAIEQGKPLPPPKQTFAYTKFMSMLKGAGVNVHKAGNEIRLAPMTDKEVKELSNGQIKNPQFLYGKNLAEIKGGFFDTTITGGLNGNRYGHLELHEKLPNPVFETAIKTLTGIRQPEYEGLIAGKLHLSKDGKVVTASDKTTLTGGKAFEHLLKNIDVDSMLTKTRAELKKVKEPNHMDALNKKVRILQALDDLHMKPVDAYLRQNIPVIPPMFRPIQESSKRGLVVASTNHLYQHTAILSNSHDYEVMKYLPEADKGALREATYKSTRALAGLEPVLTRGKDQPMEGFISLISSDKPKTGFFLQKLITKKQDLVGRGVIIAGPELHMDEVGIPEKMAWKIFNPFVMRTFGTQGYKPDFARKEIEEKTPLAKQMLVATLKDRTVLMNRAPSLHKFSIMAHKPVLTDSLAIKVPPLVLKGYGGDFDGDAVSIHVPSSEEAIRESHLMLPSRNLHKPGTGELMTVPSQESQIGIYFLSQTPEGRKKLNSLLPAKFHLTAALDKNSSKELYNNIARGAPKEFPTILQNLKNMGDTKAYESGFTTTIADLQFDSRNRDAIFKRADIKTDAMKKAGKAGAALDLQVANVYEDAAKQAYQHTKKDMKEKGNSFYHMVSSGARGSDLQLQQIVSAPGVMLDAKDRKVPVPIKKSYAEGVSTSDYFISSYGVRKGMVDRALSTSKPGALNKDIMASTINNLITGHDCGTKKGVSLSVDSPDVLERYLAHDQHGATRNTLVTPQIVSEMKKHGVKELMVRTPLKCLESKGTCGHCFGLDEFSQRPDIGTNIGAKMGQAMSEPVTQFAMRAIHTGGVSGGAAQTSGFKRVSDLLNMPKYVAGEAALSKIDGKITKIDKSPAGGFNVHIGKDLHTVRPGLKLAIKVGDSVEAGDKLSDGILDPTKLLKYKGMSAAQNYIVDELQKTFKDQGIPMQRKVFETVIRSVADHTLVRNAPKHANVLPGDLVPFTVAEHYNETRKVNMRPEDTVGYNLAHPVGNLPKFHEITERDLPKLKSVAKNGKIDVIKDPIVHTPQLVGITRVPLLRKDWMSQLGYREVKRALTQGAAESWSSELSGKHPVPAFAYGADFGKKKEHY